MKVRKRSLIASAIVASVMSSSSASMAQLRIDIAIQENVADGRLSVHGFDWDAAPELGLLEGKRAYVRGVEPSGSSLLLGDPGFVSRISATELDGAGLLPPAPGEGLVFNVLSPPLSTMPSLGGRTISYWDGVLPVSWGPTPDADEGIEILKGSFFNPSVRLTLDGSAADVRGFTVGETYPSGSLHEHLKFVLLPDNGASPPLGPDDGVYLMLWELSYPAYSEWIPVFIGVEANAGGLTTQTRAEMAIADQLLRPLCSDGIDNDKDGRIDAGEDAGCSDAFDMSERGAIAQCDNGIDDDGDGFIDFHDLDGDGVSEAPGDSGCLHPSNLVEAPEPGFALGLAVASAVSIGLDRRRRSAHRS